MRINKTVIVAAAICLALYSLTLFTPLALDQAAFANGGDLIASGGKIYKEYYDQKPPVIYYTYAAFGYIAGDSDIAYHFIDIFWQMTVCLSLIYILPKLTGNAVIGAFAAVSYAILYVSAGYLVNLQCEALAAPALIWLFYYSSKTIEESLTPYIRGLLAGVCFGLKYPMGILLLFLLVQSIVTVPFRQAFVRFFKESLGFFFASAVLLSPFLDSEIRTGYFRILPYNLFYASMPTIDVNFAKLVIKGLGAYAGDNISILFIGCITLAFIVPLIAGNSIEKLMNVSSKRGTLQIVGIAMMITVFLLVSIVAERKLIPYHFVRILPTVAALAGIGAFIGLRIIVVALPGASMLSRCAVVIAGLFLLATSPLSRLASATRTAWIAVFSDRQSYYQAFKGSDMNGLPLDDITSICQRISRNERHSLFVMGHTASLFYRNLQTLPVPKFAFPPYYFANVTIRGMSEEVIEDLKRVEWLIVQTDDGYIGQLGHTKSSWESLNSDKDLSEFVFSKFKVLDTVGVFKVLKRSDEGR